MAKTDLSIRSGDPIAIISMGAIYPGRGDTTGFWRDIIEGVDALSDVPATHWLTEDYYDADANAPDRTYGQRGGFIPPTVFDPIAFGLPPNALSSTDTAQLLALIAAKQVLDDAEEGGNGKIDKSRTSVILGVASATELTAHMAGRLQRPIWVNAMRASGLAETEVQAIAGRIEDHFAEWQESTFPGLLGNVIAGRIANRLDLGGSNYVTDAACASSLSAMQIAIHELQAGDSDMVITGGADALNDILMFMCFSKTPALSPTGECRPFSAKADGTMLGEGVGMLALRRLRDAERDGNRIHAVVRGLGGGSDGRATAIYAPLSSGQARTLSRAYDKAGYSPRTVELVEAHGTGTVAGDKAELAGLRTVFAGEADVEAPWCAVGSIKSQIGHTKAAAGAASLIKVVNALSRKVLPPTIKVDEPAEPLRANTPFYVNTKARPWIRSRDHPRRASVSSFGFGGSNFHVALEEYTGRGAVRPVRALPGELFLFSGENDDTLAERISQVSGGIAHEDDLSRMANATHKEFNVAAASRAAIVATSPQDFADKAAKLEHLLITGAVEVAPLGGGLFYGEGAPTPGKTAFMFSGQGSQYIGMGADLAMAFAPARAVWDEASDHGAFAGDKLHDLAFPPTPFTAEEADAQMARLTRMENAQPAIAAMALSHLALLSKLKLQPDMSAGHSFGEVMALHCGGVMDGETALALARTRGQVMAEAAAANDGGMLAVQAPAAEVLALIEETSGVTLANDNGPDQTVLSGTIAAIEAFSKRCASHGLKARLLPVATAFHSEIVAGAVDPFLKTLGDMPLKRRRKPVYSNTTAAPHKAKPEAIAKQLAAQIGAPVRFREMVEAMYADGARVFIEVGPGSVLSGLLQGILKERDVTIVSLDHKRRNGVVQFLSAIGALATAGIDLDIAALLADMPPPPPRPARPRFAVEISGANYGKPYPPETGASGRAHPNFALPAPEPERGPPERASLSPSSHFEPEAPHMPTVDPRSATPEFSVPEPSVRTSTMTTSHSPTSETSPVTQDTPSSSSVERIWQEVSQRHSEFLAATGAAHTAYLNAASNLLGGSALNVSGGASRPALPPTPAVSAPSQPLRNGQDKTHVNGAGVSISAMTQAKVSTAVTADPAPQVEPPAPAPVSEPTPLSNGADGDNPVGLVTEIVAEKTGYPPEMLDADMDLEGELGVDSIKQVEILSTVRERLPHLPEINPEALAELRTIRQVAAFISGCAGDADTASPVPTPVASTPSAPITSSTNGSGEPTVTADLVRGLIAEKTGYPPEMLEEDMDLEGELGVDSIKQVEILSALREQLPHLPEVEPEALAELRTIRKIADFFG